MAQRHWRTRSLSILLLLEEEGSAASINTIEHENIIGRFGLAADSFDDLVTNDAAKDGANGRHFRAG